MAPAALTSYGKDEKVLCFHGDILYEAKILDLRHTDEDDDRSPYEYLVHYKGWKATYVFSFCSTLYAIFVFLRLHLHHGLPPISLMHECWLTTLQSWDDWVGVERLRKFNEDNRLLADNLRKESGASAPKKTSRTRAAGSDRSSARLSEERNTSANARGTKRNRDSEIEKVSIISFPFYQQKHPLTQPRRNHSKQNLQSS